MALNTANPPAWVRKLQEQQERDKPKKQRRVRIKVARKKLRKQEKSSRKTGVRGYGSRDKIVRSLGYKCYAHYINSSLWKSIRQRVLDRDGGRCQICLFFEGWHVHHRKYTRENLSGESLDHMECVCGRCHKRIEFDKTGMKRGRVEADAQRALMIAEMH